LHPGKKLRQLREQLGLTVRDVEASSSCLANKRGNRAYSIPLSRLSDIENKQVVPSIYRMYSFAVIYRRDIREIFGWYGIDFNDLASDLASASVPKTHPIHTASYASMARVPIVDEKAFDFSRNCILGRIIHDWGIIPLEFLAKFADVNFSYAYIGTEDRTMYPILPPGTFVQIDETKDKIVAATWRSEYERPIYFIETREGFRCGWCRLQGTQLMLQPHPLSPEPARIYRYPQEADVVGQVVGVAMKLKTRDDE